MSVLSQTTQTKVENNLVNSGVIASKELQQLKSKATSEGQPFFAYLLESGRVTDEQLAEAISNANGVPYVNLGTTHVDPKILSYLPQDVAEHYMAVPIGEADNKVVVAMLDADNVQAVDFLSKKIGRPLKVYAASEAGIRHVISQYGSSGLEHGVVSMLSNNEAKELDVAVNQDQPIKTIVQDSPVSKALNAIMSFAAKNNASDIHIESLENEIRIRCRVDGVLREIMRLPKSTEAPLISRVKILSNLKIDEHRIPQDGQFSINVEGRKIDLRIAISPVVWGEQVIMRLLDKSQTSLKLEDMGYIGPSLTRIREGLKQPHGMILTSGPTGSGKSTSMYAMIQEIKNDEINIVTLEDPVEYKIEGVNQIQINPEVGLTFANGLRSILRQDPDVIMVGEIRDKETANLAVQAALTGHLVFSTLHTNSASGILPRLLDMEVEPFLIASTVHTVIGQRLLRRVLPGELYLSTRPETAAIEQTLGPILPKTKKDVSAVGQKLGYQNLPLATQNAYTLIKGKTTPDNPSGFKGRIGIYEVFDVNDKIQDLIVQHATSADIQKVAQAEGMVSMRQDGYLKALAGLTTLTEVDRVAAMEG